jgi:hypothetical protein
MTIEIPPYFKEHILCSRFFLAVADKIQCQTRNLVTYFYLVSFLVRLDNETLMKMLCSFITGSLFGTKILVDSNGN